MDADGFWVEYMRLFRTALESGVRHRSHEELPEEDPAVKEWHSLHIRKIIDAIAFTLLGGSTYVVRRLAYQDEVPGVDFRVLDVTIEEAVRINGRSRQTFALVTDLTTCIHVADLLVIDFRGLHPTLSLRELKSGKVNSMLLEHLECYEPR